MSLSGLVAEIDALRTRLAAVDVALLSGSDAVRLVGALAGLGKSCSALQARTAARAAAAGAHRSAGYLDPADWLAAKTGSTSSAAKRDLDAVAVVAPGSSIASAIATGTLSLEQAGEIAKTEAAVPGSEARLLALASSVPLRRLRDEARQTRLRAQDAETLAARQHRSRRLRHWVDDDGMVRLHASLPPEAGTRLLSRLDAETARRAKGSAEPWERHAADALVALTEAPAPTGRTEVVFVCDLNEYRRGGSGHIVGAGPVPHRTLRRALDADAFVKVAFHDGVEVNKVTHLGRHLKAELRTALELGPPPDFAGPRCACGCGKRYRLQFDHIDPVANGGPTCLANLQPLASREHAEKTRRDRRAGLLAPKKPP